MKRKLQVFISSTYTDLIEERQAAVGAILKAGHIPAGMELFTSGDKSQMTTIERWIEESDVYMLILGGRYGSVETSSGLSYTELEYNYAVKQGKPLFAVVIKEDALENKIRAHGSSSLERDHPQLLKSFREKVLKNISSFFSDAKDIRLCVHESLADFASDGDLKGWLSANDVEDTKPLHDEISSLRRELDTLRHTANNTSPAKSATVKPQLDDLDELEGILAALEIKIPPELNPPIGKETTNLGSVFYWARERLVIGLQDRINATDLDKFLIKYICPKLTIHGLVDSEKVPGYTFRRIFVTKKGMAFLASIDKKNYTAKEGHTGT